jgi:uncharacterized protein YqjF (DUF2071 family)
MPMDGDFDHTLVESTAHRPWPMPRAPWLMTQSWHDLLFAHWRVDASELRRVVPADFELDLFDHQAWLAVVPFRMSNVAVRATPSIPWLSAFLELNVRTYVRVADRPGVYFFSLDAARWLAVTAARTLLNLPYYSADMTLDRDGEVRHYDCARRTRQSARFAATYEPVGSAFRAPVGSIEHFLTERYCLYHHDRRGRPYRLEIHHRPWALQPARATITLNTMATASRLTLPGGPVLLHFAQRQDVVAWAPTRLTAPLNPAFATSPNSAVV